MPHHSALQINVAANTTATGDPPAKQFLWKRIVSGVKKFFCTNNAGMEIGRPYNVCHDGEVMVRHDRAGPPAP